MSLLFVSVGSLFKQFTRCFASFAWWATRCIRSPGPRRAWSLARSSRSSSTCPIRWRVASLFDWRWNGPRLWSVGAQPKPWYRLFWENDLIASWIERLNYWQSSSCRCPWVSEFIFHLSSFLWINWFLLPVEHILSIVTNIYMANICPNVDDKWKAVFMQQFTQIFTFTSYGLWKALFSRYILSLSTFCWTYMDCFVILISVGLAQLLKMLNKELVMLKGQVGESGRKSKSPLDFTPFC